VVALKTLMTATLGVKVLTLCFFDEMTLYIYIDSSCDVNYQENMEESLEELQELFDEMFQEDLDSFGIDSQAAPSCPSYVSYSESSNSNNKRVSADLNLGKTKVDDSSSFNSHFEKFCLGVSSLRSLVYNVK
jgi:hypothetical protein